MSDPKPPKRRASARLHGEGHAPRLDKDIQRRIGDKLRAMYDDVVDQGVPDRFSNLLRQFDDKSGAKDE